MNTAGSAVGALFAGPLASYGKWNCLMISNVVVILGSGITIIQNYPCLVIGRTLYGVAAGAFAVFCPKYIAEVSPTEVKGPAGAITQLSVTFGILISFSLGTLFPIDTDE